MLIKWMLDFKNIFDSTKTLKHTVPERVQCVLVNGTVSDFLPIMSGVPQGSFLDPLFFLIFINDIPVFSAFSTLFLSADDLKCSKDVSSMEDCSLLQSDLTYILNWCSTSSLHQNFHKI